MKKVLLFVSFLISFFYCFGQYPITQNLGSDSTKVQVKGAIAGRIINYYYTDTTAANLERIRQYPFAQIGTISDNKFWIRNSSATGWTELQQGVDVPFNPIAGTYILLTGSYPNITFSADTLGLSTRAWRQKGIDSVVGLIPAQFNPIAGTNILLSGSYPNITFTADTTIDPLHLATQGFVDRAIADIPPSLFGSNDTLFTADRYVNMSDFSFSWKYGTNIFGANYNQIGSRISYSWDTNPLSYWTNNFSTATITPDGTVTNMSGGAENFNNGIASPDNIAVENWVLKQTIVANQKNSTSYGLCFGIVDANGGGSAYIHYLLSDTTGYIGYTTFATNLNHTYGISNKSQYGFSWDAGDTIDITIIRSSRLLTAYMYDRQTKSISKLNLNGITIGVAKWSIYTFGGSWDFTGNFDLSYTDYKYPQLAIMGNSIAWGGFANYQATDWANQVGNNILGGWVSSTGPGEASIAGTYRTTDINTYVKPNACVIAYGVNDANGSVNLDSFSNRIQRIIQPIIDSSITPVLVNLVPQNNRDVTAYNDTLSAIASRYSIRLVDIYSLLIVNSTNGKNIDTAYYYDGIHPNQRGHDVIAEAVKNSISDIISYTGSNVVMKGLPISQQTYYYLSIDNDGNVLRTFAGADSNYIRNYPSITTGQSPQLNSNAYIGNQLWVNNEFQVNATNSDNYPAFSVNKFGSGITRASTLYAGNEYFKFLGGYATFGGQMYVNSGGYFVTGDGFQFKRNYAVNGAYIGTIFDNQAASVSDTYKIISIRRNGTEKSYIDFAGGLHTDSLSGYNYNIHSLFTTYSWVDKSYADSLFSSAGSGVTSVATDNGSGITGGTITTTGTLSIDTLLISTRAWRQKGVDSLLGLIVGGGVNNANVGAGFRLVIPSTQEIKTLFAGSGISIDSVSNTDGITITATGGGGLTIGDGITSGTANRILFEDGSNQLAESASLTFSSNTLGIGSAGAATGILTLSGSTSGTVTIQPANAAGTWTLTLPTDDGTNGQVLTTDGAGVTSWTTVSGGSVSFGSDNQIPFTNSSGDDFDYASGFTYDGTDMAVTTGDISIGDDLLFPNSGSVINFNSGDVTITHSSNLLTIAGGGLTVGGTLTSSGGHIYSNGGGGYFFGSVLSASGVSLNLVATGSNPIIMKPGNSETWRFNSDGTLTNSGGAASAAFHVIKTTEQLRLGYDGSNYSSFTISSGGDLTIAPTGGDITLTSTLNIGTAANIGVDTTTYKLLVRDASGNVKTSGYYLGSGSGTVTDFVFTDANGFDGTVTTSTSTPTLSLTTTVTDDYVMVSNSGAISGSADLTFNASKQLQIGGTTNYMAFQGGGTTAGGLYFSTTNPTANASSTSLNFASNVIVEAGSGTHALLSTISISPASVTAGAASVTNAYTVYIAGAMSASGATNGSLWIDDGAVRIDGATTFNGGVDFGNTSITGYSITQNTQSGTTYTLLSTDNGDVIDFTNGSAITVTLPAGLPAGFNCTIRQLGAGQITISPSSTTLHNYSSQTKTAGQYAVVNLIYESSDTYTLSGQTGS